MKRSGPSSAFLFLNYHQARINVQPHHEPKYPSVKFVFRSRSPFSLTIHTTQNALNRNDENTRFFDFRLLERWATESAYRQTIGCSLDSIESWQNSMGKTRFILATAYRSTLPAISRILSTIRSAACEAQLFTESFDPRIAVVAFVRIVHCLHAHIETFWHRKWTSVASRGPHFMGGSTII